MKREELNKQFGVTEEQLDSWAEQIGQGSYPGEPTGEVVMGRPLLFGEELKPVTFKETASKIIRIDTRAASLKMSRSDYLRSLVDADLATASL